MTTPVRNALAGLGLGILISVPLLLIAIVWAAGGHGTYVLARIVFPIPMICASSRGSITPSIIAVALAQFPLYGSACGALYRSRACRYYAIGLAIVHSTLALIAILQRDEGFA